MKNIEQLTVGITEKLTGRSPDPVPTQSPDPVERTGQTDCRVKTLALESDPEWRARVFRLDTAHHPDVDHMAEWAEWFIRRAFNDDRSDGTWLVLYGNPGCGKTHVARKVRRYLKDYDYDRYIRNGGSRLPNIEFFDWPTLAEITDAREFQDASTDLIEADIAVIDDIGAETDRFKSSAGNSRLRSVLNALEERWVLVTTNIPRARWNEAFGNRVADRLAEAKYFNGEHIPSYRGVRHSQPLNGLVQKISDADRSRRVAAGV